MDMRDEWVAALRAWAAKNECVRELWLFGSRAKGTSEAESDIDIALSLMAARWQDQLGARDLCGIV